MIAANGSLIKSDVPVAVLIFVLLTITPIWVFADDTHYQHYPVGGRAIGLGGAFTALASDPTGVFFNPAGLVDQQHKSIQVSTNLYGLEVADSFFDAVGRVTDLDTVFAELNVVPSAASFSGVLSANEDGIAQTSYGLGVFVPSYRSLNVQAFSEVTDPATQCKTVTYDRSLSDRTFLLGGSVSQRIDPAWSVGMSLYMAYRTFREAENVTCSDGPNRFSTAATNVNLALAAIYAAAGVKYRLGPWRFGATISTPSIRVFNVAKVSVSRGSALNEDRPPEFFARELDNLTADTRLSPELRLGAAYTLPNLATVSLDVHLHAGTRYDLYSLSAEQQDVDDAITTVRQIERRPIMNVNLGGEYEVFEQVILSIGLFTNLTSAPRIDGDVGQTYERDRLAHVHAAGGSGMLGFVTEHTVTRIGGVISYGEGSDVVPRTPGLAVLGEPDEFVKVDFSQLFAFVFLSSTFRF